MSEKKAPKSNISPETKPEDTPDNISKKADNVVR